jgi:xanthosine utilization system XapX-like protein
MVWVDAIVGAIAVAWLLLFGTFVWSLVGVGLPGPPVVLLLVLVAVAVLGLLVVVMRALLRQATTLRTDMEAVI